MVCIRTAYQIARQRLTLPEFKALAGFFSLHIEYLQLIGKRYSYQFETTIIDFFQEVAPTKSDVTNLIEILFPFLTFFP